MPVRKTLRRSRRRSTRSKSRRGGFWPFSSSSSSKPAVPSQAGPSQAGPGPGQVQYTVGANGQLIKTGAPDLTGSHTSTSWSVAAPGLPGVPLYGQRSFSNDRGQKSSYTTGVPQYLAAAQFLTEGHPKGLLGANTAPSETTTGAPYPVYSTILGVEPGRPGYTPDKLRAAYNSKKNKGTNAERKLVQNAYNTFSDPQKYAAYSAAMKQWYTAHPPKLGNVIAMQGQQSNPLIALASKPF